MPHPKLPADMAGLSGFFDKNSRYSLRYYDNCVSTNDIALEICRTGGADGVVVISDAQSGGRGSRENRWFSPKGVNIYMSAIFRIDRDIDEGFIKTLNLAAAAAISLAIVKTAGLNVTPVAPNDVYYGDRKIAGVLPESVVSGSMVRFVVIGIGVNVNMAINDMPDVLREVATSIYIETGKVLNRDGLITRMLYDLEELGISSAIFDNLHVKM